MIREPAWLEEMQRGVKRPSMSISHKPGAYEAAHSHLHMQVRKRNMFWKAQGVAC
jgi:hypothetical protein